MVTKFSWSTKISKSYILLLFFYLSLESYCIINYFTISSCSVATSSYHIKKSTFIVMACLTFYWKFRANTHTFPIFLFCLFCFMVQSSRAIDKEWGSNNDHLPPLTMAVTIYFKGLWQDFVQFLCQTKNNSMPDVWQCKKCFFHSKWSVHR